jgi:hypothetical protein
MKPIPVPNHIGWRRTFSELCDKHTEYAGNGRCTECMAEEITRLNGLLQQIEEYLHVDLVNIMGSYTTNDYRAGYKAGINCAAAIAARRHEK